MYMLYGGEGGGGGTKHLILPYLDSRTIALDKRTQLKCFARRYNALKTSLNSNNGHMQLAKWVVT